MLRSWIVVLGACGRVGFDPHSPPPDAGATIEPSGSRLKHEWYELAGGGRQASGIYDRLRGEECTLLPWSDGAIYCVPAGGIANYTDATCSGDPVGVALDTCGPSPAYFVTHDGCVNFFTSVRAVGGASTASAFYVANPTSCVGPISALPGEVLDLGPAITTSEFAPATIVQGATSGRFAARAYHSADGFVIATDPYDTVLGSVCRPATDEAGAINCRPENLSISDSFADLSCTTRVVEALPGCAAPLYAAHHEFGACSLTFTTVGDALSLATTYFASGDQCIEQPGGLGNFDHYAEGSTVVTLPTLARAPAITTSDRFAPIEITSSDGFTSVDQVVFDTALGAECSVARAGDGQLRCVPVVRSEVQHFFADADATQPIAVTIVTSSADCALPSPPPFASETTGCNVDTYRVGTEVTTTLYTAPQTPVSANAHERFFAVGVLVDPSTLGAATLTVDP